MFGRVRLRISIINDLNEKACTTSYPNTRDPEALKLFEKAQDATRSNSRSAEHVWTTLTSLLLNLAGFAVYLALLSGLNFALVALVTATTAAGFFVSRRRVSLSAGGSTAGATATGKKNPLTRKRSTTSPKRPSPSSWRKTSASSVCAPGCPTSTRAPSGCMTPSSTGGSGSSAFTGFSSWVTGILQECSTLCKESLDLSTIQEYLHLPEPFRFADGAPIPPADRYELRLDHVTFRYPGAEKPTLRERKSPPCGT